VNEDELVRLIADEHVWLNAHNAHDGPVDVDREEFSEFVRPRRARGGQRSISQNCVPPRTRKRWVSEHRVRTEHRSPSC
jgi:hypothetical protein